MTEVSFKNFNLFDGETDKVTENSWLTVDQDTGKIVDMGTGKAPEDAVDFQGNI